MEKIKRCSFLPHSVYTPLDRGMVLLQLCRWKFSHKETLAEFIRIELIFIHKNDIFTF